MEPPITEIPALPTPQAIPSLDTHHLTDHLPMELHQQLELASSEQPLEPALFCQAQESAQATSEEPLMEPDQAQATVTAALQAKALHMEPAEPAEALEFHTELAQPAPLEESVTEPAELEAAQVGQSTAQATAKPQAQDTAPPAPLEPLEPLEPQVAQQSRVYQE